MLKTKFITVLVLLSCLIAALHHESSADVEQQVVFLAPEYPPYASPTMAHQGAAIELLHLLLQGSGFKPVVAFMPWPRIVDELKKGRVDGVLLLWPDEVKQHNLKSTSALFQSRIGFYVRNEQRKQQDTSLASLKGQRICTVRGYIYPAVLYQAGLEFDEALTDMVNLQRLSLKRCDYAVMEYAVGEYLLSSPHAAKLRAQLSWTEPAFAEVPLTFGLTAQRPSTDALLLALEKGLVSLYNNQQYQQLMSRYGLDTPPSLADSAIQPPTRVAMGNSRSNLARPNP